MFNFISKLLDVNQKEVDRLSKIVIEINKFEESIKKIKDNGFADKTNEFKKKISDGTALEEILPEAFALVREATFRVFGKRHFDVQMMAATALFEGKITEQKTGE